MKTVRALGISALSILAVVGCSSVGSDSSSGAHAPESGAFDTATAEMADEEFTADPGADREIITTGSLTLLADDVSAATESIIDLVESSQGWVDSRFHTAAAENREESSHLTVRVPAADLNGTIDAIEDLGEVQDLEIHSDDVTRYARDLDARIEALETSTERLTELMAEADSSEALIAAESALSERQADLESLRSERNYLSDQVAMSTLDVSVISPAGAEFDTGGFLGGLKKGWNALVTAASGALVALGAAIPWIIVVGGPVSLLVWILKRRRASASPSAVESSPSSD